MPMLKSVWMAVGAVAILSSLSLLIRNAARWKLRIGGEALAVILWSTFAINAWAVKVYSPSGCCVRIESFPPLGYAGGVIGIALLADLLLVILGLLGDESPTEEPAMGGR